MTFAAPLFLIAALAGLIPVLLHMISRQQAKVVPFSTLRFLRQSVERTRRRKYLNDILLLLLRIAALVLIALGLAKPTITHLGKLLGRDAASAVVVILDNSASMGAVDQDDSRWDRALRAVEQILDQLHENDSVGLLVTCGPPRPEADRLYQNQENVRQALGTLQLSYQQADLAARLATARQLLEKADAPNKEIYVVTDMQQVSWSGLKRTGEQPDTSAGVPVVLVDVRGGPRPNVALRRVELRSAAPVAGVPIQVTVQLVGDANLEQEKYVELHLDGQKRQVSPTISLQPGQIVKHSFQFSFDKPGVHQGQLRLSGEDACPLDNELYFAVNLDARIPVAVVKPEEHPIKYLEDSFYLERALMPTREASWAIRVTTLTPPALASEPLSSYAVVFCVNLPALEPAAARRLYQYLQAGGNVVWTCGENVDPHQYAAMNELVGGQLLPLRLAGVRQPPPERPDGWHIGWLDEGHAALQPLVQPASLYQSVLVYKHMQLEQAPESGARVLAKLDDDQPLLVQQAVGSGSSLLLGTTVHVDWTNFPLRPLFLPLLSRLTFYLAKAQSARSELVAGTPLTIPLAGETPAVQVEVTHPSGNVERIDKGDQSAVRYTNTYQVGIYRVRLLNSMRPQRSAYALNIDPAETDGKVLSHEDLRQRLGEQTLVVCDDPSDVAATIRRMRQGESILELFLIGVLIALIAETFLANRRVTRREPSEARRRWSSTHPLARLAQRPGDLLAR